MKQQQQPQGGLKESLRESTWITISWEWLQKLLGRAVDPVLWVTMIYAGYQLIPNTPQPPDFLNTIMFVSQFIALDLGGLGLNQLAKEQGQGPKSYARRVAYILIGITLVTITYSGIHHAFPQIPDGVNTGIEVTLVIARSIMTVLYGPAIKSLQHQKKQSNDRLEELENEAPALRTEVSNLREKLSSGQQEVSTLRKALDSEMREASMLRDELDRVTGHLAELQSQLESGQGDVFNLRRELNASLVEVDALNTRLEGKQREVDGLRETLNSGQSWQETRYNQMLEAERQRASTLEQEVSTLRKKLDSAQQKLTAQVSSGQQKTVSTGHPKTVDTGQGKVVQLDTSRRKGGQDERVLAGQIRALLDAEPDLSGRAIASRLICSPTTASKWKKFFEDGGQLDECVNE